MTLSNTLSTALFSKFPASSATTRCICPVTSVNTWRVNSCCSLLWKLLSLFIAERSNTIEKSIKEMREDGKTLSNPYSSRSVPVVVSEPIAQEAEPVQQLDTRNYQRVRPVLNRTTGAIEYVADV
jgi:hypothetical protein